MNTNQTSIQTGSVKTEGDELYYEVRGHGQPLLLIPGGGGDGGVYSIVADILSDEYKVITYDRRANSRSTRNEPQNFEISQQSRDAVAVIHATGETSAFVFGSSSGAVIALDMAKTQPHTVRAIIVHEPPLAQLHPHATKWQRFFASVYQTAFVFGSFIAMFQFFFGVGLPLGESARAKKAEEQLEKTNESHAQPLAMMEFFIKKELLPVTNYMPDIATIKEKKVKVLMAAGQESLNKKRFYAQTAPILAKQIGSDMIIFPGHHTSYMSQPDTWTVVLRNVLHQAENVRS